jgi:hypothetical protein
MSQGIDKKHRMMKHKHPQEEAEIKTRKPIRHNTNREEDNEIEIERYESVMIVLKSYPFTRPEIRNFGRVHRWTLEEKPAHMSIEESFFDTVWVFIRISFCMMDAVIIGPGRCRTSESQTSEEEIENLNHRMCLVGLVRKKSMISSRDTETSEDIETDAYNKGSPIK